MSELTVTPRKSEKPCQVNRAHVRLGDDAENPTSQNQNWGFAVMEDGQRWAKLSGWKAAASSGGSFGRLSRSIESPCIPPERGKNEACQKPRPVSSIRP